MNEMNTNCTSTIIHIFTDVKVYNVDASDSCIKKRDLITLNGKVEINLLENSNEFIFKLSSSEFETSSKNERIYLDQNLKDIDFFFKNDNISKKIEIKLKNNIFSKFYHAIEFIRFDDYEMFIDSLEYLKEIYGEGNEPNKKLKRDEIDVNDQFMLEYSDSIDDTIMPKGLTKLSKLDIFKTSKTLINILKGEKQNNNQELILNKHCQDLKISIKNGRIEESALIAKKLATLNANLKIEIDSQINVNQFNDSKENSSTTLTRTKSDKNLCNMITIFIKKGKLDLELVLELDASSNNIYDLKKKIFENYDIPIDDQLLILNDHNTNDSDLISAYSSSTNKGVATNCFENETFVAHVLVIDPNDDEKITENKPCQVCGFSNNHDIKCEHHDSFDDRRDIIKQEKSIAKIQKQEEKKKESEKNYFELIAFENQELNENSDPINCSICLDNNIGPRQGVILKECLHSFCKECLRGYINNSDDPQVKCPYADEYNCSYFLQDREIRALITDKEYSKHQLKSLTKSEATMQNTFHCKTPDCIGFSVCEEDLNFFECPACEKVNCLRCNTIHMGKTCKEYQDDLKINAINDKNIQKDKEALEKMVEKKKAMYCPGCKIILCKIEGCDWLQCLFCKMEICWATRGPRWGPAGHGDTSGGCKCLYNQGKPCHPQCGNCH